jgi:hypothetical protein
MSTTTIKSKSIEAAAQVAATHGNGIVEVSEGWSKVKQVVHMQTPLTDEVRTAISAIATLRHWLVEQTPHNAGEEGFTDDQEKVAIAFPRSAV